MNGAALRASLKGDRPIFGTMLMMCRNPGWVEPLASTGLDFVVIDNEHAPYGRSETADLVGAFARHDVAPLVRIPYPDAHHVAMALDAGAHGVMVPYCETVAQVRDVVAAARYRPLKGILLQRVLDSGSFKSAAQKEVLEALAENVVVIIGVESVPAVERLEEILDVDGIDGVFVGPQDLTMSMGLPGEITHPRVRATFRKILATAATKGIPATIWPLPLGESRRWMQRGMRFVLYSTDRDLMYGALAGGLEVLRAVDASRAKDDPASPRGARRRRRARR